MLSQLNPTVGLAHTGLPHNLPVSLACSNVVSEAAEVALLPPMPRSHPQQTSGRTVLNQVLVSVSLSDSM